MEFVHLLRNASLEDLIAKLGEDVLARLHNLHQEPGDIESPGVCQSISMYLTLEHSSQHAYDWICRAITHNFAGTEGADEVLSFKAVEKFIVKYTGVESVEHDMCPESCLMFTSPYADEDNCPLCRTSCWDQAKIQASGGQQKVATQTFITIPIGLQLQAVYQNLESAQDMHYLHDCMQQIFAELEQTGKIPIVDDIAMGYDYLDMVLYGHIKQNDIVLMVSLDGAQLYESKQSDCWMYIWVIINLAPDKCYQKVHVHPGRFIPGPNKPKNLDSFLIVGMHHLAALQNEGLLIWDASRNACFISDLHLLYTTADGPGLVYWDGMVGHSGKNGHYYPTLLKPQWCAPSSGHPDIQVFKIPPGGSDKYAENLCLLVASLNQCQLDKNKTDTGITKPPLILGLKPSHCLRVPHCMTSDIMHIARNLSNLNINDVDSWDWAVLKDRDAWEAHGRLVEAAGPYLPGSFDCKPCNIAEKLNTSYKTWEFQLYTFGLGSALLYGVLPQPYWLNYCKLVYDFQLLYLRHVHVLLCNWEKEFETLYYQFNHLAPKTLRKGPLICYVQWTMEHMIGNLGQEIQQPLNPYANLSQEGLQHCQLDEPSKGLPTGSVNLGDGYALLQKHPEHAEVIAHFLGEGHVLHCIKKWAHLLLPNGHIRWEGAWQIVRSAWRETIKPLEKIHILWNVKIDLDGQVRFGKILYFTQLSVKADPGDEEDWQFINVALIQLYSAPDNSLLKLLLQTVASCIHLNEFCVLDVKKIFSVVAMVPHTPTLPSGVTEPHFFMMERLGLDISNLGVPYSGYLDAEDDLDDPE
ncbi:hypothetical protein BDR06DRAFT_978729 [Suillus hirtellus]|nr:hypothetical protein BDR06DRAFT_978729 [Suillus hirtellus]